jgi:hypothetical protein
VLAINYPGLLVGYADSPRRRLIIASARTNTRADSSSTSVVMFALFCHHCRHWADGRATEENVGTSHAIGAIPSWEQGTNIKPMSPACWVAAR